MTACSSVTALLLEEAWFNENAETDIESASSCPKSFANAADAQILLGSVMPEL